MRQERKKELKKERKGKSDPRVIDKSMVTGISILMKLKNQHRRQEFNSRKVKRVCVFRGPNNNLQVCFFK